MERFKRFSLVAAKLWFALCITFLLHGTAHANSMYLYVPGIVGENPTPGYPGAMALHSLTIVPQGFSVVKNVDMATPGILQAITNGTPFSTADILLYNSLAPSGPPDAKVGFKSVLASAHQSLGGGITPTEKDTFNSLTPASMYLQLPGIGGESSTPGHPGVMQIQSFSLDPNAFSVVKNVDKASPGILQAVTHGTLFSTANILLYNSLAPAGEPDATLTFQTVVASGYQPLGGIATPSEKDTFSFRSVTQPAPEPGSLALLGIGLVGLVGAARRRSAKKHSV